MKSKACNSKIMFGSYLSKESIFSKLNFANIIFENASKEE